MRLEDGVDVIGHDYPRVELVEPTNRLAIQESVHHNAGDSRILQPGGAGSLTVEPLVLVQEGSPTALLNGQIPCLRRAGAR